MTRKTSTMDPTQTPQPPAPASMELKEVTRKEDLHTPPCKAFTREKLAMSTEAFTQGAGSTAEKAEEPNKRGSAESPALYSGKL